MSRSSRAALITIVLIGALGSTGCFNYRTMKMDSMYQKIQKQRVKKGVPEHIAALDSLDKVCGSVTVNLQTSQNIGCTMVKTPEADAQYEVGRFNCKIYDLEATEVKAQKAELTAKLETVEGNTGTGFFLLGFGDVAALVLKNALKSVFDSVTVNVSPQPAGSGVGLTKKMHHYQGWGVFSLQTLYVTMVATPSDGSEPITVDIESEISANKGLLGWGIPIFILFFPIGAAGAAMAVQKEFDKAVVRNFVEAMEKAALELASQMSGKAATAQVGTTWTLAINMAAP